MNPNELRLQFHDVADKMIRELAKSIFDAANILVEKFKADRATYIAELQRRSQQTIYWRLVPNVAWNAGRPRISWLYMGKGKKRWAKRIPMGSSRTGRYSPALLSRFASKTEMPLVEIYEEQFARLRGNWAEMGRYRIILTRGRDAFSRGLATPAPSLPSPKALATKTPLTFTSRPAGSGVTLRVKDDG